MAPQILEKRPYSTKCDIWSIGMIFFELLTGRVPWTGTSESDLLKNIKNKPLLFPKGVSEWSKEILNKMLVIDEAKRITWDELFKIVLKTSGSSGKSRGNSAAKSNKEIKSQKEIESSSHFSVESVKNLWLVELSMCFDAKRAMELISGSKIRSDEKSKIRESLELYN